MPSLRELSLHFVPERPILLKRSRCCDAILKSGHVAGKSVQVCSKCGQATAKNTKPRDGS